MVSAICQLLRKFVNTTCTIFDTKELPSEEAARGRRAAALAQKNPTADATSNQGNGKATTGPKSKTLNLATYKLHALADYCTTIRQFGTTDSYSTQIGELEHRRVKRRFARTNKHKFMAQLAQQEARERFITQSRAQLEIKQTKVDHRRRHKQREDSLPYTLPTAHHHISESSRNWHSITPWLMDRIGDRAVQNFLPQLIDHLLARFLGLAYDGDEYEFTDEQRGLLQIDQNRLYEHSVLRVNYTTYDVRRAQDSINPRTHPDVMVLSYEDDAGPNAQPHPYWYARILGIFHVMARYVGPGSQSHEMQRMDFLWVRWLGLDPQMRTGWAAMRLPAVGFVPESNADAFGFIDPQEVLRGVHLIPAFHHEHTTDLLNSSSCCRHQGKSQDYEEEEDWNLFYVNLYVSTSPSSNL
ncbi:hypothetical protein EW146_g8583 [Bondarzewia mesenterica]|uniref:Uncharacterized protein n=1 Tax=Bondarzewia mesenterica TaxID=1095465 RepID=A0A4S4LD99_9AGAM|nr:hypothetical protein EW146_g8583 [Bondarzewia mesenterica]